MEEIKQPMSMAYGPRKFFQLGEAIAGWCDDTEIRASFPVMYKQNGRMYFLTRFGYAPTSSGHLGVFAYDEHEDEFLYWGDQDKDWSEDTQTVLNNAENYSGMSFKTLEELTAYIDRKVPK